MSQIRADNITNRQGTGAPIFVNGIRVVGLTSISNIVAGTGTFSGAVSIGGTLTYEDVTNIDAVGLVTARTGVKVLAGGVVVNAGVSTFAENINVLDNKRLNIGAGSDLQLYHDGSNNYIDATNGDLYIRSTGTDGDLYINVVDDYVIKTNNGGQNSIRGATDGGVKLYYSNSQKFETTSGGVNVTGGYTENIVAVSGTAVDCATGSYFTKTITGATTFTFTNVPTGVAYAFTFEVTLNGSNAITWPGTVKWPLDTAPTLTDGKTQLFTFITDDGGTRWRANSSVDYVN